MDRIDNISYDEALVYENKVGLSRTIETQLRNNGYTSYVSFGDGPEDIISYSIGIYNEEEETPRPDIVLTGISTHMSVDIIDKYYLAKICPADDTPFTLLGYDCKFMLIDFPKDIELDDPRLYNYTSNIIEKNRIINQDNVYIRRLLMSNDKGEFVDTVVFD